MWKGTAGGLESLNFDLIQSINLQAALEANERKETAGGLESLNFDLTQSINQSSGCSGGQWAEGDSWRSGESASDDAEAEGRAVQTLDIEIEMSTVLLLNNLVKINISYRLYNVYSLVLKEN